jgi:hypothetical protein
MISSTHTNVRRLMQRPMQMLRSSVLTLACLAASACAAPEQDTFKGPTGAGGISPDPSGIIAGSILYVGPRPSCEYENGKAKAIIGRVVLTLFAYGNPPPPEGRATTALNIAFHNPERLFSLSDCLPNGAAADPTERITRSMDFSWPQIPLGSTAPVDYQVRGFYDSDGDMIPFFSVRNLPTAGDIIGGAVVDPQDPAKGLLRITMPPADQAKNGYRRQGVIVALGNYVWLERPAFQLSAANRFLDSASRIVVKQDTEGNIEIGNTLLDAWGLTCGRRANDCGLELEPLKPEDTQKSFEVGGVALDFSAERYAFVSEPVDLVTIKQGEADVQRPDGVPDPHPLMGSNLGIDWYTPITIMTRTAPTQAMADVEALAGIPNVRLIGSPLLENTGRKEKRVTVGALPLAVPSVAAVELDPNDVSCRLPYLAPNNLTRAFESRLTYCHELPTGLYGVSVIQGAGGGVRAEQPNEAISDNGYVYDNARLPGQVWTLPNDLALTAQVGEGNTLGSQGRSQLFVVFDSDPDNMDDCTEAPDPDNRLLPRPVNYRGICEAGESKVIENAEGQVGAGIDGQGCLPEHCCDAIEHLCGVPLCEVCDEESCPGLELGDRSIRQGPTSVKLNAQGRNVPNCVPFELPDLCCDR